MRADGRPLLGISTGDPGGIGPEITVKALAEKEIYDIARPLAVSDHRIMAAALQFAGTRLELNRVADPRDGRFEHGCIDMVDMKNMDPARLQHKQVTADQGAAAFDYIVEVIRLAMEGVIDGTVTGPINKAALHAAGKPYAGHTEIFAAYTDAADYTMMLTHSGFRVAHVSTHVSLREACDRVKKERIVKVIDLTYRAMIDFGIADPKIAVAGLNPHCGEGGLFGHEDDAEIRPAVAFARRKGWRVEGPVPADTVFPKMKGGWYDAVVVMYHDQGHIPTKLLGFQYDEQSGLWGNLSGVNITLGLPIVRTSVDHGTAFDIAGEGLANPQSMIDAICLAARLSRKP